MFRGHCQLVLFFQIKLVLLVLVLVLYFVHKHLWRGLAAAVQEYSSLHELNLDIFFFFSVGTRRDVSSWERLALTIVSCPLWDAGSLVIAL